MKFLLVVWSLLAIISVIELILHANTALTIGGAMMLILSIIAITYTIRRIRLQKGLNLHQ